MQNNNSNVVSVAPDALVYINGKDGFHPCKDCSCDIKLRDVITSISIDLSITSSPGSATISISNPQHVTTPLMYKTESVFSAMQEVEIFIKGYFTQNGENVYHPVFWGFITTVNEQYSDGVFNITLSCKDILRWWDISKVNTRPSTSFRANFFPQTDVTIYQNIYATMSIADIIFQISKTTVNELLKIDNINSPEAYSEQKNDFIKANTDLMQYWKERFLQIGKNLRIYGYIGSKLNIETVDFTTNFKNIEGIKTLTSLIPDNLNAVGVSGPEINKFVSEKLQTSEVSGTVEGAYESKLETVNKIKENIQYEFFMDPTGEILFKPPFYNIDVRKNPIHVIEDKELIDFNFSEDETPVVTRVEVSGLLCPYDNSNGVTTAIWDYWVDYWLAKQYGLRVKAYSNPWLRTREQCKIYALSEISRLNALIKTGSVHIIGRAEARLGYPIYVVSKDAFYYVTGIQHAFSFGGSFTTTLTLSGERKKLFDKEGNIQKNLAMKLSTVKPEDTIVEKAVSDIQIEKAGNPNLTYETIKARMDASLNQNKQTVKQNLTAKEYLQKKTKAIYGGLIEKNQPSGLGTYSLIPDSPYTDAQIYEILRIVGELNEFKTLDSANPFSRISSEEANIKVSHVANKTVNALPFLSDQSDVKFVNEVLQIKTVEDFINVGIQLTDSEGYSLIGVFNYGRDLSVLPTSKIGPRKLTEVEKASSRLAEMAFNNTLGSAKNITENSIKPTGVDAIVTDPSVLASGISIRSWDAECKCGCHDKFRTKYTNRKKQ